MKKYFITGVCGFVGRYFVECLRSHEPDADIVGIDIMPQTEIPNIQYFQLDLTNKESVRQILAQEKPNYIVHLAAISSVAQSWQDPATCFLNNVSSFLNLVENIRDLGIACRMLVIGSSEEYGQHDSPLKEDLPLNPQNPYAVTKVSQEYLSKLYADRFGMDIVMTRSFNHIGPGQSTRFVIPSFIEQLVAISEGKKENKMMVGNIDVIRDFLDVRDVVEAYYTIMTNGKKREVYNVCSGVGVKLRDIIKTAAAQLNITPCVDIDPERIRVNEVKSVVGDNAKLRQELGWYPLFTIEQTIKDIIEALPKQGY